MSKSAKKSPAKKPAKKKASRSGKKDQSQIALSVVERAIGGPLANRKAK